MKKKAQPACRYLQKNSRIALSWNRPRNPEAAVLNLSRHIVQANRAQTVQNRHKMRANASKCQQIVVSKKPKLLWRSDLGLSTLEVAKYFCETVRLYDLDHQKRTTSDWNPMPQSTGPPSRSPSCTRARNSAASVPSAPHPGNTASCSAPRAAAACQKAGTPRSHRAGNPTGNESPASAS